MLQHLQVLFIGGDARNLEIIDALSNKGITIFLIGYDQLSFDNLNIHHVNLSDLKLQSLDAIVLPVAGTTTSGDVEATYSDKTINLSDDIISQCPAHCVIYTGTSNAYLDQLTKKTGKKLVKLFDRDDLAILNSIPTAEGALKIAIEETDKTIHGSKTIVLGFGRVGMTVARLFSSVGANVFVGVRKSRDMARITEMGLTPMPLESLHREISSADLCINTITHPIIDAPLISTMKKDSLIIDLASAPGGTDFASAKKNGVNAIHALGLPGKTAPKTAGKIISNVLMDLLAEQRNETP